MIVQAEIARAIVTGLRIAVSPTDMVAETLPRHVRPEALNAYLKGRYAFDLGGVGDLGVGYFREAVRLDPELALGWATLATRALAALTADDCR